MNAWDGIFGILGKFSFINKLQSLIVNRWYLNKKKLYAWPNLKAKKLITPERIGNILPEEIADEALYLLSNEDLLDEQKANLLQIRGDKGAVRKLSSLILETLATA